MAIDYTKGMRPNLYELMQGGGTDKLNINGSNADSNGFTVESSNISMQLPSLNGGFIVDPMFAMLNHQTSVIIAGETVEIDSTNSIKANAEGDITVNVDGDFEVRTYDAVEELTVPYIADPDGSEAQIITLGYINEYSDTPVSVLHVTSGIDPVTHGPALTCAESYDVVWEMVNNFHKKPIMLIFNDLGAITSFVVKEVSNTNSSVTVNYEMFDYYNNRLSYTYKYITVNNDNSISSGSTISKSWSV